LFGLASFVTEVRKPEASGDAFLDTLQPTDMLDASKSKSTSRL